MTEVVLDSSALLAYLFEEPGAEVVAEALASGACISAVNFSEVLAKLSDCGIPVDRAMSDFAQHGLLDVLRIIDFDLANAEAAADLRTSTRKVGLSLGDRACLALGRVRKTRVLTADEAWSAVSGVEVVQIRP